MGNSYREKLAAAQANITETSRRVEELERLAVSRLAMLREAAAILSSVLSQARSQGQTDDLDPSTLPVEDPKDIRLMGGGRCVSYVESAATALRDLYSQAFEQAEGGGRVLEAVASYTIAYGSKIDDADLHFVPSYLNSDGQDNDLGIGRKGSPSGDVDQAPRPESRSRARPRNEKNRRSLVEELENS